MTDYKEMFHDIIVESQGEAYIKTHKDANPITVGYHNGVRHGVLLGVTQTLRKLSEEGHVPEAMYNEWHTLCYSEPMNHPEVYRAAILKERSERK